MPEPGSAVPSTSRPKVAIVAVLLAGVAVVVVAGLLWASGDETGAEGGEDAVSADDLDPRIAEVFEDESLISPLSALLGIEFGEDDFAERELRAQLVLTECMAERGFVYVPVTDMAELAMPRSGSPLDLPPLDQVQQVGYGIADSIDRELARASSDAGPAADPNDQIRAALSEAELIEYERALNGFSMSDLEDMTAAAESAAVEGGSALSQDDLQALASEGCLFEAYLEDADAPSELATEMLFSDAFAELQAGMAADPGFVELERGWSECMASEGYDYEFPEEPWADILDQADLIVALALEASLGPDDPAAVAQVAELRTQEIEVAVADWHCSQDLAAGFSAISRRHELQFIQANEGHILAVLEAREAAQ